ncbi:condensation domain-containing protein [Dactylosporangium sp. NPDC005555]|uniref:condensation domain-containing protein n=1 Tax=Dactylosporangium sp. NPDC005555 TaxID=3154889 RepID=UPI0033B956B7
MPLPPTTVHFSSGRAAEGPLIWAQAAIWDVFRWLPPDDSTLNLLVQCPVPTGRGLGDVAEALRHLVERHDSLHTLYVDTPEGPRQRVVGEGDIPLRVHDIGDHGTDEAAADLGEQLRRPWFDIGADLPLRAAVLVRDDEPVAVLLAASHMAVDGTSLAIVRGDLLNLLQDPPVVVDPGQQPLQRVDYETSPVGLRREAKALSYWSKHLTGVPTRMIESIRDGRPPNLDWGQIQSPALALATNSLAARFGVPPATVLLAGITLQLAAYTGGTDALLRMIVATRFRPASRALVGAFNQNALFRLAFDIHPEQRDARPAGSAEETVGELLHRASDAALLAYAHCEYDPGKLEALFADVAADRGITPDGYCFFNDTRFSAQDQSPPALPSDLPEAIHAALPATKLRAPVIDRTPKGANFFMFLTDLGDTAELMLCAEHGFLGERGPLGFLAGLERLIVRATLDEHATTRLLYREATA